MRIRVRPCLTELRRAANRDQMAARRFGDEVIIYPKPDFPGVFTSEQLRAQEAMKLASLAYGLLDPEARAGWEEYAELYERSNERQSADRLGGRRLYSGAAIRRLMLAADPPTEAPLMAPSPPPTDALELLPVADGAPLDTFAFRVRHRCPTEGVRLVARIGAAMPRLSNKPDRRRATLVCGFHPASAAPLPASGAVVTYDNARVAVAPGSRFGVWLYTMRVVDGIASPERFYDLVRS